VYRFFTAKAKERKKMKLLRNLMTTHIKLFLRQNSIIKKILKRNQKLAFFWRLPSDGNCV